RNNNTDTPLPPEIPAGQNPPDGAMLDYWLPSPSPTPVVLEISDASGKLVRRFSSDDKPSAPPEIELNVSMHWIRPEGVPVASAGMHRFVWDLHYPPPDAIERDYPISAIIHDTPLYPLGPAVLPGDYTVKLIVGGKSYSRPLTIKMDPRVKTSPDDLRAQFEAETRIADAMQRDFRALQQAQSLRARLQEVGKTAGPKAPVQLKSVDDKAAIIEGTLGGYGSEYLSTPAGRGLARLNSGFNSLLAVVQSADAAPTTQALAMFAELEKALEEQLAKWQELQTQDLPVLNKALKQAKLAAIALPGPDSKESPAPGPMRSHHEDLE
ncbi:MAG TPA: hypothetical protein VK466_03815, partial [Terriglobales bacterium]|nr:hypothetical protein [Terriglobales bacterium]